MVTKHIDTKIRPFIKYAGGKRWLVPTLAPDMLPETFGNYHEPFLGGGALYWHLNKIGLLQNRNTYLADNNPLLMATYLAVRSNVEELIGHLKLMKNSKEEFYQVREELNKVMHELDPDVQKTKTKAWLASRVLYINKFGYNGLLRMNKKGEINTPYGNQPSAKFNFDLLLLCSKTLAGHGGNSNAASLLCIPFQQSLESVKEGDLVYMDPPYIPRTKTENFTSYTEEGFGDAQHVELAQCFKTLASKGAYVIVSNSDTSRTRDLYKGFRAFQAQSRRSINSVASKREPVSELLVFSWGEVNEQ